MRFVVLGIVFCFFVSVAETPRYGSRVLSREYLANHKPSKNCTTEGVWSGTKDDLVTIAKYAESLYGFENTKHLGRNATMLVPATKQEMEWVINHGGIWDKNWKITSVYHQDSRYNPQKWGNTKYKNVDTGSEAVYDDLTGRIIMDERLGTRNLGKPGLWSTILGKHKKLDMRPHDEKEDSSDKLSRDGDQYKYVGILFEHDPVDPNVYYIVDGQTGRRMTNREVLELPTTMSDMWKDMGLACVKNDAKDMVTPMEDGQPDLHNLDLDDPNGDWCKCEERGEKPGCKANMDPVKGYVFFGCTKCKKVNVKYAKMALELEQKMKDAGVQGTWFGQNAKENAHKAASEPGK